MDDNLSVDEQNFVLTEEELAKLLGEVPDIVQKILQENGCQSSMIDEE